MNKENPESNIVVRQVHIQSLVDALLDLWHQGLEYVDLHGELTELQDRVYIGFSRDYMDPEYVDNFDDITSDNNNSDDNENGKIKSRKLSDEDLNQLT